MVEGYYRVKEKREPGNPGNPIKGLYVLDAYSGYTLRPSLRRREFVIHGTNTKGEPSVKTFYVSTTTDSIRSARELSVEHPPGVLRLMVMGSSFEFGYGVNDEDTFPAVLEKRLRVEAVFPLPLEVINGAVPGTHRVQFIYRYLSRLQKYDPDVVIMVTGPDIPWGKGDPSDLSLPKKDPDYEKNSPYYIDGEGVLRGHVSNSPFWRRASRVSAAVKHALIRVNTRASNTEALDAWVDAVKRVDDSSLTPIRGFNDILRQDSKLLMVVVRHMLHNLAERPTPQDVMVEKLARLGIPALNLRPLFEPFEGQRTYILDDGHWNEGGHQLVADAVYRFLAENKENVLRSARERRR